MVTLRSIVGTESQDSMMVWIPALPRKGLMLIFCFGKYRPLTLATSMYLFPVQKFSHGYLSFLWFTMYTVLLLTKNSHLLTSLRVWLILVCTLVIEHSQTRAESRHKPSTIISMKPSYIFMKSSLTLEPPSVEIYILRNYTALQNVLSWKTPKLELKAIFYIVLFKRWVI